MNIQLRITRTEPEANQHAGDGAFIYYVIEDLDSWFNKKLKSDMFLIRDIKSVDTTCKHKLAEFMAEKFKQKSDNIWINIVGKVFPVTLLEKSNAPVQKEK